MKSLIISTAAICLLITGWFFISPNKTQGKADIINKSHVLKQLNFTLPDLNGRPQQFSQWNGKVVLLNFWATWCPPCRREIPDFIEVYEQYKDKDFMIVGVGIDDENEIAEFVKELAVNYPILVGGRAAMQVSRQYGNHSGALPYSIIVDKQGNIRFRAGGLISKDKLLNQINPLL
ncbi:MAG: TlpA family protein disulfide reductase [gamma proteobacterium symbiont of Taylorina sp.]|nr:TlpA family protein disulfide reductase [gamma proteobacterium symbiont of Taylorina sp.]